MKIRVEYDERRSMTAIIEAESIEEVEQEWAQRYGSALVDEIEETAMECDGGVIWDSVEFEVVK